MSLETEPFDLRRGAHGLVALVAEGLQGDTYSRDIFVFRSAVIAGDFGLESIKCLCCAADMVTVRQRARRYRPAIIVYS